jgi:replicative DNA helicase
MHPSAERKPATTVEALKVPPHSIEAEQAVLGGLMLAPEAWERIADRINEDDFYRRDHRLIFRAIQTLSEKDQPCDAITLGEWFAAQNLGDQVGGMAYVIELANTTPSAANIVAYADIVREKSVLRQLIDAGTEIAGDAFQPEGRGPARKCSMSAEQKVYKHRRGRIARGRQGFRAGMRSAVKEAFQILHQPLRESSGQVTGLSTGFADLDEMTARACSRPTSSSLRHAPQWARPRLP